MKTLYLHIGIPKTGTTALQAFLMDNRKVLKKNGYCYPVFPFYYEKRSNSRNALFLHIMIIDDDGNRDREKEERNLRIGMKLLEAQFARYDNIILSDEVMWMSVYQRRASLWKELLDAGERVGFQLKVVVYLRRQDQYVSSWWNQLMKKRNEPLTETWEQYQYDYLKNLQPDYDAALEKIGSVIGKENIIVRVFERGRFYGGTIQADFLHAIGLELTPEYKVSDEFVNERLNGNTHEIKRILNTLPHIRFRENEFFMNSLLDFSAQSGKDYPAAVLSPSDALRFLEPFLEGNRKIAREYLGEEDSLLFDMTFPERPKWEKDNPYMLDDVIRLAGSVNRRLLRIYDRQGRELEETRKRIRQMESRLRRLELGAGGLGELLQDFGGIPGKIWRPCRTFVKTLKDGLS